MLSRYMFVGPLESLKPWYADTIQMESLVFFVPLVAQRNNGILVSKDDLCAHLERWSEGLSTLIATKYYSTNWVNKENKE